MYCINWDQCFYNLSSIMYLKRLSLPHHAAEAVYCKLDRHMCSWSLHCITWFTLPILSPLPPCSKYCSYKIILDICCYKYLNSLFSLKINYSCPCYLPYMLERDKKLLRSINKSGKNLYFYNIGMICSSMYFNLLKFFLSDVL